MVNLCLFSPKEYVPITEHIRGLSDTQGVGPRLPCEAEVNQESRPSVPTGESLHVSLDLWR